MSESLQRAPTPQTLLVEPFRNDFVDLFRGLSQGPVRCLYLSTSQFREEFLHSFRHFRLQNAVVGRCNEERWNRDGLLVKDSAKRMLVAVRDMAPR